MIDTACTDFEEFVVSEKLYAFLVFGIKQHDMELDRDARWIAAHNKVWRNKCVVN